MPIAKRGYLDRIRALIDGIQGVQRESDTTTRQLYIEEERIGELVTMVRLLRIILL